VRDISVFREVTAGNAQFFSDNRQPETIAEAIREWLALYRQDKHLRSDTIPHLTWAESTRNALDIVLSKTNPYRTWLPDGVRRYWGADPRLHTQVGEGRGRSMHTTGQEGYLVYGPYERFEPGQYRIIMQGYIEHIAGNEHFEIFSSKSQKLIFSFTFMDQLADSFNLLQGFELVEGVSDLEVRVWCSSESRLSVEIIEIKKMDSDYDYEFAVINKSYHKDMYWSKLLYLSWLRFSTRSAPYFIIVPRHDVREFNKIFSDINKYNYYVNPIILAEEDVMDFSKIVCPDDFDGWRIQQIIKLCFSKTGFAKNYLAIDSAMFFTKNFDFSVLYSDDSFLCTSATPRKKKDLFDYLDGVHAKGFLKGQLVNLSLALDSICNFFGNKTVNTNWYIYQYGMFNSDLCKDLESYAQKNRLEGFVGLLMLAPYEFAWYGEFVFFIHPEKFRPREEYLMEPCFSQENLSAFHCGNLKVADGRFGFVFQPPAQEYIDFERIEKMIVKL
jgi:hypothetical protein